MSSNTNPMQEAMALQAKVRTAYGIEIPTGLEKQADLATKQFQNNCKQAKTLAIAAFGLLENPNLGSARKIKTELGQFCAAVGNGRQLFNTIGTICHAICWEALMKPTFWQKVTAGLRKGRLKNNLRAVSINLDRCIEDYGFAQTQVVPTLAAEQQRMARN